MTKEVPATGAVGFAGNIVAGGLVGMGGDAVTGAAQDHKPNPVIVTLKPIRRMAPPRAVKSRGKSAKPEPEAGT